MTLSGGKIKIISVSSEQNKSVEVRLHNRGVEDGNY